MMQYTQWDGFRAGNWQREIDVRSFIQKNYTLYEGGDGFLAGPTARTMAVWEKCEALLLEDGTASLLVIVGEGQLARFRLPVQVKSDFVMRNASPEECAARIRQLLWPGNEAATSDCLVVENMTVNLATYQVTVAGEPLDLTYLEYALLAFLVTHPSRTYSRDALLRRVWGFDYYGGSRTVDVHVRRIRAKLGPELAQHLETVRGVGYLWSA